MLSLNELWFLIISTLFIGFFVLEGFDFGVGTVAKFLGRNDLERRIYINTIGPFWDANEVWLVTAGGTMFAAFPHWYATLFSGFYIPFVFMLLALILRGVAFEFRGKVDNVKWKNMWDWAILIGSFVPPLLWGIAITNFMVGVPINENKDVVGGFVQLLHPFALLGGLMFVLLCVVHGLQFITLRTTGELQERARIVSKKMAPVTLLALLAFVGVGVWKTDIFIAHGTGWIALPLGAFVALFVSSILNRKRRDGWAFFMTSLTIILLSASVFIGMFPRVMISTLGAANDLTIYNAASGPYSLKLMSYLSLTILPFVLGNQIWSYYVFRKRIKPQDHLEY
ncbi:cytochrome d ubiquinol oxidase subunit II [Bacillus sp. DX1.1]|uniref:cytochrome d ubiquinol oxidase subunit II n=1 Tax=unclassified Bacillus (in: firmicutes) TaxID=185979 RepID=UPI00256FC4B7|nr:MULTISPECIES: cytochrome d ubiquinol oxidase subunit II [unclassified Bacillus (in: firmicutes)]MDM5154492.1 cytochrome d ubiquinol oxidase subunit II [Bacillus sp. DX1.1]WJE83391.1 cytochrome d ubiquinol oxidase subunit II [Bacillus sp. DX3.1]